MSWPWDGYTGYTANSDQYDYMNLPSTSKQLQTWPADRSMPQGPPSHKPRQRRALPSLPYNSAQMSRRDQHMARVETWLCKICNKEFKSKSGLSCHFTLLHEPRRPEPAALVPYRQPPFTPKAAYPEASYTPMGSSPLAIHTPFRGSPQSVPCGTCGKQFASKSGMLRHAKSHTSLPAKQAVAKAKTKTKLVKKTSVTVKVYNEFKKYQY